VVARRRVVPIGAEIKIRSAHWRVVARRRVVPIGAEKNT